MPDQDGTSPAGRSKPVSSSQPHPADATLPTSDSLNAHQQRDSGALHPTTPHDSTEIHDDVSEAIPKGGKFKPSDTLRRSQACLACRKRKLRCDAKKPTCTRCEKAWLAYHPAADASGSSTVGPPPCEYDTSLLAKIFKTSSPDEGPHASTSHAAASRSRGAVEEAQSE